MKFFMSIGWYVKIWITALYGSLFNKINILQNIGAAGPTTMQYFNVTSKHALNTCSYDPGTQIYTQPEKTVCPQSLIKQLAVS